MSVNCLRSIAMKGDFSRPPVSPGCEDPHTASASFGPYCGVLAQQGQPLSDLEWNENVLWLHESLRNYIATEKGGLGWIKPQGEKSLQQINGGKTLRLHFPAGELYAQGYRVRIQQNFDVKPAPGGKFTWGGTTLTD